MGGGGWHFCQKGIYREGVNSWLPHCPINSIGTQTFQNIAVSCKHCINIR